MSSKDCAFVEVPTELSVKLSHFNHFHLKRIINGTVQVMG